MLERHPDHPPTHPGAFLRNIVIPDLTISQAGLARRLGVSRQSLICLIHEKRGVSVEMALRLSRVLGSSAEFWLSLQHRHDLWHARQKLNTTSLQPIAPERVRAE